MKKTLIIGGLLLFTFVGFRPPQGMRKLPSANIEFSEQSQATASTGREVTGK